MGKKSGSKKKISFRRILRRIKINAGAYLAISPFLILFALFSVIPVAGSCLAAFTDYNMAGFPPSFVGAENFKRLFLYDDTFISALKNTAIVVSVVSPLSLIVCFLTAWFIMRLPRFMRGLLIFVFVLPTFAGCAYLFSDTVLSEINEFFAAIGISGSIFNFFTSFGMAFLAFCGGLASIPAQRYEAAAVEGMRSRLSELFYITIPAMGPYILFAAVIQTAAGFSAIFNGEETAAAYAARFEPSFEFGYVSAVCAVLFIASFAVYIVFRVFFRYFGYFKER